jgi:hypothetical protein
MGGTVSGESQIGRIWPFTQRQTQLALADSGASKPKIAEKSMASGSADRMRPPKQSRRR